MPDAGRTEHIEAADGGRFDGTAFVPDGGGPGLLLLQEIFGVGEFLRHKAQALAAEGYVVLCPDVFWRVEPHVELDHDEDGLGRAYQYVERFAAIDAEVTRGDLLAALGHLRAMPEVTGRVGVMGYCLGGRLAYEVAVAGDPDTCVSYYGSGIAAQLDDAARIECPVLFQFGGADAFIPQSDVEQIRRAFAGRPDVELHVYGDAGHAFENSFAPAFSVPEAAARSWPVTLAFLDRTLRG